MNDGLRGRYREALIAILSANQLVERAVLFGSRATEAFTVTSDVDIALEGDGLTLDDLAKLAEKIDNLSMPQQVDLLLCQDITNKRLLEHIKRDGVEWYKRSASH